ncbi:hypothetical protein BDA96_03G344800 [Sorghum bicolor]|uniref:Uncharacterized protein n=2 Tax=Sorghum bicolor TaxID=4558 RepID=A0A1W0W012_SORBI|nr:hypothetical protein BDA96_03G344800 [Sorghum bicolor]OQU87693.1 hypothetical protein SORBI_3003G319850 [Sorghum bicolor]OQU87694.1 hypothetical protein SORBI_3003G319850 [Sorghum bicolor]OQU87695.1 hypothetical protein SORBI_3003G319850 [Sorghum bicolor]OQU87696.1 hypothetical protein SORBI_3003G319850 [Sorghum bicolor]
MHGLWMLNSAARLVPSAPGKQQSGLCGGEMLAGAIAAHEPAATPLCASTSTHACPLAPLARPPAQRALVRASPLAPRTRPSELCLSAARALVRASPLAPRARLLELCLSAPRVRWLEPPRWSASAVCARPLASRACMLKTPLAALPHLTRAPSPRDACPFLARRCRPRLSQLPSVSSSLILSHPGYSSPTTKHGHGCLSATTAGLMHPGAPSSSTT